MLSVLLIEDDLDHCDIIRDLLNAPNDGEFEVSCAHTVDEATRLLAEGDFSCVILDHNLPDGRGTDLLENAHDRLEGIPVIGLSTSRDPAVAIRDFQGGCVEFLQKHRVFTDGTLRERILAAVALFRRHRQGGALQSSGLAGLVAEIESVVAEAESSQRGPARIGPPFFSVLDFERAALELHTSSAASGEGYALLLIDTVPDPSDNPGRAGTLDRVARLVRATASQRDLVGRNVTGECLVLRPRVDESSAAAWAWEFGVSLARSGSQSGLHAEQRPPRTRVAFAFHRAGDSDGWTDVLARGIQALHRVSGDPAMIDPA